MANDLSDKEPRQAHSYHASLERIRELAQEIADSPDMMSGGDIDRLCSIIEECESVLGPREGSDG